MCFVILIRHTLCWQEACRFLTTTAICSICFYCLLVLKLIQGLNWLTVSLHFVDMRYTTLVKKNIYISGQMLRRSMAKLWWNFPKVLKAEMKLGKDEIFNGHRFTHLLLKMLIRKNLWQEIHKPPPYLWLQNQMTESTWA